MDTLPSLLNLAQQYIAVRTELINRLQYTYKTDRNLYNKLLNSKRLADYKQHSKALAKLIEYYDKLFASLYKDTPISDDFFNFCFTKSYEPYSNSYEYEHYNQHTQDNHLDVNISIDKASPDYDEANRFYVDTPNSFEEIAYSPDTTELIDEQLDNERELD